MQKYKYQMMEFYNSEIGSIDYSKYYVMREKLYEKIKGLGSIGMKLSIIKALLSADTKIIPTELEREDYGCDVGYIVAINLKGEKNK